MESIAPGYPPSTTGSGSIRRQVVPPNGPPQRPEIHARRESHMQVVKMGRSTRALSVGLVKAPLISPGPASPDESSITTDLTDELRATAPNLGRDMIALSTTATPMQVSMTPQEEMQTHVQLEQALKSKADPSKASTFRDLRGSVDRKDLIPVSHRWVMHPHGRLRLRWDVICIALIFYNAFVIPFQVTFEAPMPESEAEATIDHCVDVVFGLDILLNFFTGVEIKNKVHFGHGAIATNYVLSWLVVDVISTFPFAEAVGAADPSVSKVLKLFRLFRLLRLFRMLRILNRLQHALLIRSTISSLFRYCLTVVFISHWFACIFFYVSYQDSNYSEPPVNTWLKEKNLLNAGIWDQYVAALYWAMTTLSTVGYGDVSGISANERLFAIYAMFSGAGIFAYGITNIVSLVSSLTAQETRFREKMDEINEYMAARELPRELRVEIREFFQNARKSKENDMLQEQELLNELSAMLRSKIALAINDHFLWKFPFFKGSDPNFIMDLALSMRMICFAPFEDVCVEGELGHEMFFIFRGAVEVIKDNIQITVLGENQYFGEMAILNRDCKRMATVRTLCFCELRMLSRVRFLEALVHFPKMMQKLANYSKARANGAMFASSTTAVSRRDSDLGSASERKLRRKSSLKKPPGYRLNWVTPPQSDPAVGETRGALNAETMLQLEHIKRVQDVLVAKVKNMHALLDKLPSLEKDTRPRIHSTPTGATEHIAVK
ncbi:Voltage-gated Ion Channel (VIC) Superfamily [Achlya hypogyna]|uniref:Voltage-gated Ion Channel (VIC) Superfamily n=1 Tax=Achlya hypogyna TaxID=1202772 RepID=A0A1V9YKF0_ACHHY|nr:Voltage-gated Ion Channel (VIC) Superfamily [Achlya hypogyna]